MSVSRVISYFVGAVLAWTAYQESSLIWFHIALLYWNIAATDGQLDALSRRIDLK